MLARHVTETLHHPEIWKLRQLDDDEGLMGLPVAVERVVAALDDEPSVELVVPLKQRMDQLFDHMNDLDPQKAVQLRQSMLDRAPPYRTTIDRDEIALLIRNLRDLLPRHPSSLESDAQTRRFATLTFRSTCPACAGLLAADGPFRAIDCRTCGEHVGVPISAIAHLFRYFEDHFPTSQDSGTHQEKESSWAWTFKNVDAPPCPGCGEALDLDAGGEVA